ncbi:hypothetical protein GGR52DRAFT_545542 [Hypoxylon sp. FL1284]|nr:hypothetical protein GGR52DRAFT_545542 [Hypoxylon sp. FL1284]
MRAVPVTPTACANWKDGNSVCPREGTQACSNCKLVLYCGRECQAKHWGKHKKSCKSRLMNTGWLPAWDREGRLQYLTPFDSSFGMDKHLWGNTPATDILQLHRNEGISYHQDVRLLLAASGDLRNVVKTIQNLPNDFGHQVIVTINDLEPCITIRNAILLLLALTSLEDESDQTSTEALAEVLIHVWYSAMITGDILQRLQSGVKPLIERVCEESASKEPGDIVAKTWSFKSGASLRLVLTKEQWGRVSTFLDIPEHLTPEAARGIRHRIVLAPQREDYRDRWFFKDVTPSMRVAKERYREDGLVLPFGHPRLGFDYPNPTLFLDGRYWPINDKIDPLRGWPPNEVRITRYRAVEDVYGRFLLYIRGVLLTFIRKIATGKVQFQLFNTDATELAQHLEEGTYDRIETSNIPDNFYLGTHKALQSLLPLLKSPSQNQHATVVAVYQNAVMEIAKYHGEQDLESISHLLGDLLPDVVGTAVERKPWGGAEETLFRDARNFVRDVEGLFRQYATANNFRRVEEELRVAMKEHNTIVDPWPTRPKLRPGEPGAKEEFGNILATSFTGVERYVEWKRVQ